MMLFHFGALAQLGERNTGSVEVSGSIPLGSTKNMTSARRAEVSFLTQLLDSDKHFNSLGTKIGYSTLETISASQFLLI